MSCTALLLCLTTAVVSPPGPAYNGRDHLVDVQVPRLEASIAVDGRLDEPAWQQAARLTGFSRYAPNDGEAADDSTEVLVWYSATALHIGIRAFAEPGTVRATLADRDKIYSDDYVGIFIGTFNDGRQATVFAANPLGVQGDGILVESGNTSQGFGGLGVGREATDITPDYVFESKGLVTEFGYQIEFRIPFKTLTYQPLDTQTWTFNVLRKVQSRGAEYSWAPARRSAASYVGQHGHLVGLTQLSRGLVLDVNPVLTRHVNGGLRSPSDYHYAFEPWQVGANVRWGITNNLTLNGTVRPDFAEVESDAGQFVTDPRQSLRFAEKRPFFLDGVEQFNTPSGLVYTRRILSPDAAVKVTGKLAGTNVALLSALDDTLGSASGHTRPLHNILRLQRDLNTNARIGLIFTDKEESDRSNRVGGADFRYVFGKIYSAQLQGVWSSTARPGLPVSSGPLWMATFARAGTRFGARYAFSGISDDFYTATGFIGRPAIVHASADHRYTLYGAKSAVVQSTSFDVVLDGTWQYQKFVRQGDAIEKKLHLNLNFALRGGWTAGGSVLIESFGFDPGYYGQYAIERHRGPVVDTVPFTGVPRIANLDYVLTLNTPQFKHFGLSALAIWGRDENFFEWAPANIGYHSISANWRPTDRLRVEGSFNWQYYVRPSNGSVVGDGRIPRIKVEYQINRALFVRALGQYVANYQDALRDDSRTNDPLLIRNASGVFVRAVQQSSYQFQPEALVAFAPSPGTVLYAGYRSTLTDATRMGFDQLARQRDGYFVKASYLYRR